MQRFIRSLPAWVFAAVIAQGALSAGNDSKWGEYFQQTLNASKPHKTLETALQLFEQENQVGFAVDLGAGTGRDTLHLLRKEWGVLAIDQESLSEEIIRTRAYAENFDNLETQTASFSTMTLPEQINLINASFTLPFASPEEFPSIWESIVNHLAIGGRFSGHFFGDKDEWASSLQGTFLTEEQVRALFDDRFTIEYFHLQKERGKTAEGPTKFWHVFHVVAKRIK